MRSTRTLPLVIVTYLSSTTLRRSLTSDRAPRGRQASFPNAGPGEPVALGVGEADARHDPLCCSELSLSRLRATDVDKDQNVAPTDSPINAVLRRVRAPSSVV